MKLSYIALGIDDMSLGIEGKRPRIAYASEFGYRTNFINNFLSRSIRKARFKTDGTFRMLSVRLSCRPEPKCKIVPPDVLQIELLIDRARYETTKAAGSCDFFLDMLDEGFHKAAKCKDVPLQELLQLVGEFRTNGCKNEWLHKKKRFKDYDIEVSLNCSFTTLDFKLVATIKRLSTKEVLCSGVVLQTEPDELCFDKEFKDILIDGRNIVITDFLDRPNILINLDRATEKTLTFVKLSNQENR